MCSDDIKPKVVIVDQYGFYLAFISDLFTSQK